MRHARSARSLIEMLVVIAVLGTLFALAAVAVNRARENASRLTCLNNLRQLALAVHHYDDAHKKLPPYSTMTPKWPIFGGWWIYLMPYADQAAFHDRMLTQSHPVRASVGRSVFMPPVQRRDNRETQFALLTCPSDPSAHLANHALGTSNYLANWYVFGNGVQGCYGHPRKFFEIGQGFSSTVLFAEGYSHCGEQVRPALTVCCSHNFGITPRNLPSDDRSYLPNDYTMFQVQPPVKGADGCDYWRTQTGHAAMPVALADGSARFIEAGIPAPVWKSLIKDMDVAVDLADW